MRRRRTGSGCGARPARAAVRAIYVSAGYPPTLCARTRSRMPAGSSPPGYLAMRCALVRWRTHSEFWTADSGCAVSDELCTTPAHCFTAYAHPVEPRGASMRCWPCLGRSTARTVRCLRGNVSTLIVASIPSLREKLDCIRYARNDVGSELPGGPPPPPPPPPRPPPLRSIQPTMLRRSALAPPPVQPEPLLRIFADPAFDHIGDRLHRALNIDLS